MEPDYKQQLLKVTKHSSTEIKTDIAFTIDYYLFINGGIKVNTRQARYNIYHNVRNDSVRLGEIYG